MYNKTDEQLMLLVKQENKQAFGTLVKRYLPKALSYAENLVKDSAEDLVQETFVKVWQKAHLFNEQKAKFSTWFYTILNNNCYSYLKKHCNLQQADFESIIETLADCNSKNADIIIQEKQKANELFLNIKKLNLREQQAIKLRYFKELTNKQTAQEMNSSVKAIETLLIRAKRKLKQHITNNIR